MKELSDFVDLYHQLQEDSLLIQDVKVSNVGALSLVSNATG